MRATCATFVGVDDLISVVVVAIRLRVMAQIVCGAAGVARAIFLLSRACFHIWFHMCIRVCYVVNFVRWGKISGEHWCVVPCVFLVSSVEKSDCT